MDGSDGEVFLASVVSLSEVYGDRGQLLCCNIIQMFSTTVTQQSSGLTNVAQAATFTHNSVYDVARETSERSAEGEGAAGELN